MLLQLSPKIRMSWHRSAEVSDAQRIGIILGRAFLELVPTGATLLLTLPREKFLELSSSTLILCKHVRRGVRHHQWL